MRQLAPHLGREDDHFRLRWFTPAAEVELCGPATLASAHVLRAEGRVPKETAAVFETLSGRLTAVRDGDWIGVDFPATPAEEVSAPAGLLEALGLSGIVYWTEAGLIRLSLVPWVCNSFKKCRRLLKEITDPGDY